MNEMKPEDVMRALECCLQADGAPACYKLKCPARLGNGLCFYEIDCEFNSEEEALKKMLADALALLREKDAEIKGLVDGWSKDQDRFEQVCAEKDAEIERLEELCKDYHSACATISFERDDAIKRMNNLYNAIATRPQFRVIDTKTDEDPDLWKIASKEDWAKSLCYCDMEGFAITEDGGLILCDECGRYEYASQDRFMVIWETKQAADIRAEAITEFAENLKSHVKSNNKELIEEVQKFIDHWEEKMKEGDN